MSVAPTTRVLRFTVFLGVEDEVHAGMPLMEHLEKKLYERHGLNSISIQRRSLRGGGYASMMDKAKSAAGKPGHALKFVLMDADRHKHHKQEKYPPEHYSGNGFIVLPLDPCAECVVLRLKEEVPETMRCSGCEGRLGVCDSIQAFRAIVGDVSLEKLSEVAPLGDIIRQIEAKLAEHRAQLG